VGCHIYVSTLPISTIFQSVFGAVPTVWYIFFFIIHVHSNCLMWPSRGTVKYGHVTEDRLSLNAGLIDMKCTVNGNKN
jgi:hypothetical protein